MTTHRLQIIPLLCAVAVLHTATFQVFAADTKDAPGNETIKSEIRGKVPRYLKVESVETELIRQEDTTIKMNFDAKLSAKEDLFVEDIDASASNGLTPALKLLKRTQTQPQTQTQTDAKFGNVYGVFLATWRMDHWTFEKLQIDEGLGQFGKPRSAFGSEYLISGTPEADAAIKAFQEAIAAQKKSVADALDKSKKKQEEIRAKEEQERRQLLQALLDATAPGTIYEGVVLDSNGLQQGLRMRFIEQSGPSENNSTEQNSFIVKCELVNPGNVRHHRIFVGEIHMPKDIDDAPLVLGPENTSEIADAWVLYTTEGKTNLKFVEGRWEGDGNCGYNLLTHYTFKLVRKNPVRTSSSAPAPAVTPIETNVPSVTPTAPDKTAIFSKPLPEKSYRTETVAEFADSLMKALNETERASGHRDIVGTELRNTLNTFNNNLYGQPVHLSGKFKKVSSFLGNKKLVIETGPQTSISAEPRVGEKETIAKLQPGDVVEIVGEYNNISKALSDNWTLEVSAAEIVSIHRAK